MEVLGARISSAWGRGAGGGGVSGQPCHAEWDASRAPLAPAWLGRATRLLGPARGHPGPWASIHSGGQLRAEVGGSWGLGQGAPRPGTGPRHIPPEVCPGQGWREGAGGRGRGLSLCPVEGRLEWASSCLLGEGWEPFSGLERDAGKRSRMGPPGPARGLSPPGLTPGPWEGPTARAGTGPGEEGGGSGQALRRVRCPGWGRAGSLGSRRGFPPTHPFQRPLAGA